MINDLGKDEKSLAKFYEERKLFFKAYSCALNLYELGDKFVYQRLPENEKQSIVEKVCDNLNEVYDLAFEELDKKSNEALFEIRESEKAILNISKGLPTALNNITKMTTLDKLKTKVRVETSSIATLQIIRNDIEQLRQIKKKGYTTFDFNSLPDITDNQEEEENA